MTEDDTSSSKPDWLDLSASIVSRETAEAAAPTSAGTGSGQADQSAPEGSSTHSSALVPASSIGRVKPEFGDAAPDLLSFATRVDSTQGQPTDPSATYAQLAELSERTRSHRTAIEDQVHSLASGTDGVFALGDVPADPPTVVPTSLGMPSFDALSSGVDDEPLPVSTPPVSRETAVNDDIDVLLDNSVVSRETVGHNEPGAAVPEPAAVITRSKPSITDAGEPVGRTDDDTPIAREAARAIQVLNVRQEHWPRPTRTRVLTVANQKGGVGKTTSAVNIAAALALHGLRVLLIDLDPQGNASTALGIEHGVGTPSIYDVLLGGEAIADVAQVADFAPTLRCVPATLDLAGADIELTSQVAREYRLQKALATFLESKRAEVDYVLIDCPPSLGLLTLNALVAAREVLLPIQCEYYALEGLAQLLKTVDLVTSHLNPDLVVTTVLLTMYDSRTRLADQVADEVRRHFGPLVLEPTIPRNVRVSEAPGYGQTVITYDPGSRGAIGYVQAAHEIAERGARGEHENVGQAASEKTRGRESND